MKHGEPQWKGEPIFVEEKKDKYKEGDDAGPSGVHEHEPENDVNPSV